MISEVRNIDCMIGMAEYPDKYFDLAIVDPPYGIGAGTKFGHYWDCTKGSAATNGIRNKKKSWDTSAPTVEYWTELSRVSENQIVWGGNYFTNNLPISRGWILYDKKQPETNDFSKFELAWSSFDKISMKFEYYPTHVTQGVRIHPTQKPVALYKWLLKNYAQPGDKILDTHLGSGSSRIAAYEMGFDFTGYEIDKDYFEAQEKRFNQHKSQLKIFQPL